MKIFFSLIALALLSCSDPANTQYAPIGSGCVHDYDCGTPPYSCATTTAGYPNGYCETTCKLDKDCPQDSICNGTECRRKCADDSACRTPEGYKCLAEGGVSNVCEVPK